MNRILIVEDDETTAASFRETLEGAGYATRVVHAGAAALCALDEFQPRLVLLDIGLDGPMDGFAVLGALRQTSDAYVMIVSGRGRTDDIVRGLMLQADDYLVKPVGQEELLARVLARLRREMNRPSSGVFYFGDVNVDLCGRCVIRNGQRQILGDVEVNILTRLLQTPGQVASARDLLRAGWGLENHTPGEYQLLGTAVHRLRAKLGDLNSQGPSLLVTIRNHGYIIVGPISTNEHYADDAE